MHERSSAENRLLLLILVVSLATFFVFSLPEQNLGIQADSIVEIQFRSTASLNNEAKAYRLQIPPKKIAL